MPTTVEKIEQEIRQLPTDQLKVFRRWYEQFDAQLWDEQLEQDIQSGALDQLADQAIKEHNSSRYIFS
jgi:hypothetical protein